LRSWSGSVLVAVSVTAEIAAAISAVLAKTLAAKAAGATWDANAGKLKLTFKRPSPIYPPQ
jgi:hypothetical protein